MLRMSNLFHLRLWDLFSSARENVWFTFERLEYSFGLVCGGINIRQPLLSFENQVISATAKIERNPLNLDQYCDNVWQEHVDSHPFSIIRD